MSRHYLIGKKRVAEKGDMSERHLDRLRANGEGPPEVAIGVRAVRFFEDEVDAWLEGRRRPRADAPATLRPPPGPEPRAGHPREPTVSTKVAAE